MKKYLKYILLAFVIIAIIFGIAYFFKANYSQVTVFINEDEQLQIYKVRNWTTLDMIENPSMEGYVFAGWYYYETDEVFDFKTKITEDITIVAKWAKVIVQ